MRLKTTNIYETFKHVKIIGVAEKLVREIAMKKKKKNTEEKKYSSEKADYLRIMKKKKIT